MGPTEKLLAEIEAEVSRRVGEDWDVYKFADHLYDWLPELLTIVREQQVVIGAVQLVANGADDEISKLQKQLKEMRGDLAELLADIGEWDEYTPVVKKMRAKYLEVKP